MSYTYNFPNQRIPEHKKDEEWHKMHIINFLNFTGTANYTEKKEEISSLYYDYSAMLTETSKKIVEATITQRCGEDFGPKYEVYPLIENKIDELVGKYRKRPLKRHLSVNNPDAVIKKLDTKMDMITEQLLREANQDIQTSLGFAPETENPDMQLPKDIEEFFSKDYRTLAEETAENILNQILIVRKEKEKIFESLKHFLICERTFAFLDEKDGHPSIFVPHVLDCFTDIDSNESIQKNFNYFAHDKFMSFNEIYNTFENLTEREKDEIEQYPTSLKTGITGNSGIDTGANSPVWYRNEGGMFQSRVVSLIWKSRKKVRFLSVVNEETQEEEFKLLDESEKEYQSRSRDNIKTMEIEDIRHITMIGPNVVLTYGSLKDQMQTVSNKKARFVPAIGLIKNNPLGTGEIRSIAKKLKYLQDFASEILYEIRLAARQSDGNLMAYDLSMTPKEWLVHGQEAALKKVDFHIKRDRKIIFNSKDKRSNPYASSVNISNSGRIRELIEILALIEDLADKISGVRSGQNPYQKAATAEINYEQDTDRIEEYFGIFDTYFETVLERLLLKGKHVYKENQVFSYFGGDNLQKFLTIFPDYFVNDIGLSIADNRKEYEKKKRLDEVAGQTFSNAGSPQLIRDLLKIWNSESLPDAEGIMDRGLVALEKVREENTKQAQAQMQAEAEAAAAKLKKEEDLKREGFQNNIDVALIYANNKADDTNEKEANNNLRKMADIDKELKIHQDNLNKENNQIPANSN